MLRVYFKEVSLERNPCEMMNYAIFCETNPGTFLTDLVFHLLQCDQEYKSCFVL